MPFEAAAPMEKSRSAMRHRTILILEDDDDRVRGFQSAVASLGWEFGVRIWRDAPTMIAECPACFAKACLISLDHDLEAMVGEPDPGTGLDVAEFLTLHRPCAPSFCTPVILTGGWRCRTGFAQAGGRR